MNQEAQAPRGTAIIIEDSVHARNIIAFLLRKNNYSILEFANGEEALASFNKNIPKDLKIVFSDIMMPKMNGLELVGEMRSIREFDDIPIVFISAAADKEFVSEARKLQVHSYLLKPLDATKIIDCLKKLFPGEPFTDLKIEE